MEYEINELLLQIFSAFVVVPLSSWLKDVTWKPNIKTALVVFVSLVFGVLSTLIDGAFNPEDILPSMAVVFTVATLFYRFYFEHTQVNQTLEQKKVL